MTDEWLLCLIINYVRSTWVYKERFRYRNKEATRGNLRGSTEEYARWKLPGRDGVLLSALGVKYIGCTPPYPNSRSSLNPSRHSAMEDLELVSVLQVLAGNWRKRG